jgi:hypothetical protein
MNDIGTHRTEVEAEMRRQFGDAPVEHSIRFRRVSTGYPHIVTLAYGRDIERAACDSDEQVAVRVAAYERGLGREPRDWYAIGAEERDGELPAA